MMWRSRLRPVPWIGLPVLVVGLGCFGSSAPKTVPVSGKVTYQGEPVTAGRIVFVPIKPADGYPNRPASADLKPDGSYELSTFESGDGAVPGQYAVSVETMTGGPSPEDPFAQEVWAIPKKFADPAQSGQTASISADARGPLELDFDLQKP